MLATASASYCACHLLYTDLVETQARKRADKAAEHTSDSQAATVQAQGQVVLTAVTIWHACICMH
jgi:hypothetical protein